MSLLFWWFTVDTVRSEVKEGIRFPVELEGPAGGEATPVKPRISPKGRRGSENGLGLVIV